MKNPIAFLFAVIVLILSACETNTPQPTATDVPVILSVTVTPSLTRQPPTATQSPSATPSPVSTLPIFPTLVPATPDSDSSSYHLAIQTADQAHENLVRIEQIIVMRGDNLTWDEMNSQSYYRAAWHTAWNALAFFPDDLRAETWRWKMAYYMALSGDADEAVWAYSSLISDALNSKNITMDELSGRVAWGNPKRTLITPSFVMQVDEIAVPHVEQGFIVTVGNPSPDTPTAVCFLITENSDTYSVYFIQHSLISFGYNTMSRDSVSYFLRDVTGDGTDEIIMEKYSGGHVGGIFIKVYDISSLPPKELPFYPGLKNEVGFWGGYLDNSKPSHQIIIVESLGFCDTYAKRIFNWNGKWFDLITGEIDFDGRPGSVENCFGRIITFGEEQNLYDAIGVYGKAFAAYEPVVEGLNRDFVEEFRVLKGLYSAYLGDVTTARTIFSQIASSPLYGNSAWVVPAQNFLRLYQAKADLYRADSALTTCSPAYAQFQYPPTNCLEISLSNKKMALAYTVANVFELHPIEKIPNDLKSLGVRVRQYGMRDFDKNGEEELWVTLSHPSSAEIELWVAARYPKGIKILFVASPDNPNPDFSITAGADGHPITSINGAEKFKLVRNPLTGEPFIVVINNGTKDTTRQKLENFLFLRQKILDDASNENAFQELRKIASSRSICPFTTNHDEDETSLYDCAAFYYTVAFSAELAGEPGEAVEFYHKVWSEYPSSPFAILARLRLEK